MSTKILTLKGTCQWAKVFPETRDMMEFDEETGGFTKPSSTGGRYSLELVMTPEDYRELKMSGSIAAKHSKMNEAGDDVVRFKREHVRKGKDGVVLEFASGAPKVTDGVTDEVWSLDEQGLIGNGSEVEITVAVYTTKFSPGTRLETVKVLNHVPVPDRDSGGGDEIPF